MKSLNKDKVMDDKLDEENKHIIKNWEPLKFEIDENYEFVPKSKIFNICSNILYYVIAIPILSVITKIIYDLKIEGKENIDKINNGAITVSNHVLILDCAMVGLSLKSKKIYYTTQEGSFKIPFVRKLIKLLRAIPIPSQISNKKLLFEEIDKLLKGGNLVHFYPEASLWPYCTKLRRFKGGAFNFAVRNDVPIVPIVFVFRDPKGIRKIFKRKKDVTLKILEPIKINEKSLTKNEAEELLKQQVFSQMEKVLKNK